MKKIAILCGGNSPERDISLKSGNTRFNNIDKSKFEKYFYDMPKDYEKFINDYKKLDLVVPVFHGVGGEDGELFAFLNNLGIKYLYSDFEAHCLAMNKFVANQMVKQFGYDIPDSFLVQKIKDFDKVDIKGKVMVKPNRGGSSIDTENFDDVQKSRYLVEKILKYDDVMIQKFIKGRELTVSLFGDWDKQFDIAGIIEILTQRDFFDKKAKYELDKTQEIFPNLDDKLKTQLSNTSIDIYFRFKFKTLARIDYLYTDDKLYFLEINTIPGFTPASLFPKSILYYGFDSIKDFITYSINNKLS